MRFTRNHTLFILSLLGISALYFCLRLSNILSLPLFTDEAIYVRWAQIAAQDANWRFISLTDGKQPMYVWIAALLLNFFRDPLLAGRMVSVLAGYGVTIGLFFLGSEIFRDKNKDSAYPIFSFTKKTVTIGIIASLFYVLYPFGLVYDRMALYDSLVGMFAVWSLYLLVLLVRTKRLDIALISGLVMGGGLLTKSNAFFSMGSMPFLLLLFDRGKKDFKKSLVWFIVLGGVAVVMAMAIYTILRLSPFYHIIDEKTALFAYPLSEWIKHPFTYFWSNLRALLDWFTIYMKLPVLALVVLSLFIRRDHFFEKILLVFWFLFPFIYLAFFGNTIYPRFILFMTLPLIPLASYSIYQLLEKHKSVLVKVLIFVFAFGLYLHADYAIIYNFSEAPIPRADLGQYINNWSAGNGVRQSVEFFKKEAKDKNIYIMTEGTFGLMPFGLEMYLVDHPNIKIQSFWPIGEPPPAEVLARAKVMPTYAIFYQPCPSCGQQGGNTPPSWKVKKIATYKQGKSKDYYSIYQILP